MAKRYRLHIGYSEMKVGAPPFLLFRHTTGSCHASVMLAGAPYNRRNRPGV